MNVSIPEEVVQLEPVCMRCSDEFSVLRVDHFVEMGCRCRKKVFKKSEFQLMSELRNAAERSALLNGVSRFVSSDGFLDFEGTASSVRKMVEGCPKDKEGIIGFLKEKGGA